MTTKLPPHILVDVLQPGGEWVHTGVCLLDPKARGFLYHKDYEGIPLDPMHLNYRRDGRRFPGGGNLGDQTLPNIMRAQIPGPFAQQCLVEDDPAYAALPDSEKLHRQGTITRGAVRLRVQGQSNPFPVISGWKGLTRARDAAVSTYIKRVAHLPTDLVRSFSAGEGGARPKATVRLTDGSEWIAKFNTPRDPYNVARVEAMMHVMAADAGLESIVSRIEPLDGQDVLLMARYDRDDNVPMHRVALADLVGIENHERVDMGKADYLDMLQVIRSLAPEDIPRLYQQMIFHAAVNNTDNHLRNFEILARADGWRLAPNFDTLPDPFIAPMATRMCRFQQRDISLDFINRTADAFGVSPDLAKPILDTVAQAPEYAQRFGLVPDDRDQVLQACRPDQWGAISAMLNAPASIASWSPSG